MVIVLSQTALCVISAAGRLGQGSGRAGDQLGFSAAELAESFGWHRKASLVPTPAFGGRSRIEREDLASDQRRCFVPCPACGGMPRLRFEPQLRERGAPETARYHCDAHDHPMQEHDKPAMLGTGEWRATAPGQHPHTIGFQISGLNSPVGWLSWARPGRSRARRRIGNGRSGGARILPWAWC
jgi:hypothetical protein